MHLTKTHVTQILGHLANGKTVEEVAKMVGITCERVKGFIPKGMEVATPEETVDTEAKEENWEE